MPFYLGAIGCCLRFSAQKLRENALFVSCALVGLVYAHHAFARAGIAHLAQAMHPFTLGVLAATALATRQKRSLSVGLAVLLATSLFVIGKRSPLYQCLSSLPHWEHADVAGDSMVIEPNVAQLLTCTHRIAAEKIPSDEQLLIAPFAPSLYPVLGRRSPLYELYFLFPATDLGQEEMIRQLSQENVNWALLSNQPLDGREDRRLSSTHRLLWQHLTRDFEAVEVPCLNAGMQLRRRVQRR